MMKKLIFVFFAITAVNSSNCIVRSFSNPADDFNNLVVDKNTGLVYVAAANRLYKLSPDLELVSENIRGPTNNVNKVLVIDYLTPSLISCGTAKQTCDVHRLHNISDVLETKEAVVTDNPQASTVAFIAPGLQSSPPVIYVGVTHTSGSEVPAVSTRSLNRDSLFQLATTSTKIYVNSLFKDQYFIKYIYGFSSKGFSYFLTNQRQSTNSNEFTSKLIRICQNDDSYYSYTEIPLHCKSRGGRNYNLLQAAYITQVGSELAESFKITPKDDVLFAIFSESVEYDNDKPSNNSALCVYPMKTIERKLTENIRKCFQGTGELGLDFITPSRPCMSTQLLIGEYYCGLDINSPLGVEEPVSAEPVRQFRTELTAIAVAVSSDFTIAFIGTSTGHLKKVIVESDFLSTEYEDLVIDEGFRVNSKLHFDPNLNHLYVVTEKKVSKVQLSDCDLRRTCEECVKSENPYCGWCSLENKCCSQSLCENPTNWISYKTKSCPRITEVTPKHIQVTTTQPLNIMVENLPNVSVEFQCTFTILEKSFVTRAKKIYGGIRCSTPQNELSSYVSKEKHYVDTKLSISTTSGADLATTNFKFFECNSFSTCTECVSSDFPCDWCVDGNRCTHNTAENCRNDILITGISRIGPSYRSGPKFCSTTHVTQRNLQIN